MKDFTEEEARQEYLHALIWALVTLLVAGMLSCTHKASPAKHKGYHPRRNTPSWAQWEQQLERPQPLR